MQHPTSPTKRAANSPLTSEFDKKSRLGLSDQEIATLNDRLNSLTQVFPPTIAENVALVHLIPVILNITSYIVSKGSDSLANKDWLLYENVQRHIESLTHTEHLELASIWVQAHETKNWARLTSYVLRQPKSPVEPGEQEIKLFTRHPEEQQEATEKSWLHSFSGRAAEGLWEHIVTHFNPSNRGVYAHYASIVQSSGMGKSRTVDQLALKHFVIPLNLRAAATTGYPPADHSVRDYITIARSSDNAYDRVSIFLVALFEETANVLREIRSSSDGADLVTEFRSLMTKGQNMTRHNKYREEFYSRVILDAERLQKQRTALVRNKGPSSSTSASSASNSTPTESQSYPPSIALRKLEDVLDPPQPMSPSARSLEANSQATQNSSLHSTPLIILAFDEAHTITERHHSDSGEWSIFNELRHALRSLHHASLFTLFLSTTGKISQFTSTAREDISKRVVEGTLVVIEPYADLGFDRLARKITANGSWDLDQLAGDRHMSSLGRPLFATRYIEGSESVKRDIILFATSKLIHADDIPKEFTEHQSLACLSQRFPIEFNSTNYIYQEGERKQVEGHMRVCLKIDEAFETMTTTSSSEPILSEAAYYVMSQTSFNAPEALKLIMQGFSISKGDRGEFLVLLLLTLARDATVGTANEFGRPLGGVRHFDLVKFLYGNFFRDSMDASLLDPTSAAALQALRGDFPNARLHFNHFVKVHEYKAIDLTSLLLLQGRGAAVLCANGQKGIDAINIFLKDGKQLVAGNAGLILYQMKNDSSFTAKPKMKYFALMDPYDLGILTLNQDPPVPIIKILFALAAKEPSLYVRRHSPTVQYNAIVYEIWCAGISPDIFAPIEDRQTGSWDALLQASYSWKDIYKNKKDKISDVRADLRRSAAPGAARDDGHYNCWTIRS